VLLFVTHAVRRIAVREHKSNLRRRVIITSIVAILLLPLSVRG